MNHAAKISISVLFVDARDIFLALEQAFGPVKFMVHQAIAGDQALEILQAVPVDLLVANVQSSDLNWVQQAMELHPALQVVLLSDVLQHSMNLPASSRYIVIDSQKPHFLHEVHRDIERGMEIKRIREELIKKEAQLKGAATNRTQVEGIENQAMATRIAISALLETSLEPLTLVRHAEVILDIILTIPCFSRLRQGALFLMDEVAGSLQLVGHRNLLEPLLALCAHVPLGHCLCGKAAARCEVIFTSHLTDEHETRCAGMHPHGHYCIPIISKGRLFGILCLHLPVGYLRRQEEDAILFAISNTLALILEHRKTEGELRKAEEQLRFMAYHDPLTGLHNRQYFDIKFNKVFTALQNANRRQNAPPFQGAFLAIFDIDHFKKVNDTYGHLMGDEVLVLFARMMNECFRDKDALFRFGGEEFVVLLNDLNSEAAEMVLNRFRTKIEAYVFPQVGQVTVSIGGVKIEAGELAGTLIEKADKSLYFSKEHGRNQVHLYHNLIASGDLVEVSHDSDNVDLW